jgi:hypothetical protein
MGGLRRGLGVWFSSGMVIGFVGCAVGILLASATARVSPAGLSRPSERHSLGVVQAGGIAGVVETLRVLRELAELAESLRSADGERDAVHVRVGLLMFLTGVLESLQDWLGEVPRPPATPAAPAAPEPDLMLPQAQLVWKT